MSKEEILQKICSSCKNLKVNVPNEKSDTHSDLESIESKCRRWLEDTESDCSSEINTNSTTTQDTSESDAILEYNDDEGDENNKIDQADKINPGNAIYYIRLKNCKNIKLGSNTYIHHKSSPDNIKYYITTSTLDNALINKTVLRNSSCVVKSEKLSIISRTEWLAQPPIEEKVYLQRPAKFVIISHTASEDRNSRAENILLIRLIQTFHIESRNWNDIAYNFLIGSDGNVYEGRGWGVVGAHTHGYNNVGIGISFVGCFLNKLPPATALRQAKELIKYGIETGNIDKNYILVGHCQCSSTKSPGEKLFEEIQTWENWTNINEGQNSIKS